MPKKLFQRYMPDPKKIREIKGLQFLGDHLHSPNLWHLNRRSVANAFACGLFAMYTPPLPWQMIIAGVLAVIFSANLPIAVALVWITNPLTWIPMYYFAYRVGALVTGRDSFNFSAFSQLFSLETAWELGAPFLLGCFILMVLGAILGYFSIHAFWRWHVRRAWEERKLRRLGLAVERKTLKSFMQEVVLPKVEWHLKAYGNWLAGVIYSVWYAPETVQKRAKLLAACQPIVVKIEPYLRPVIALLKQLTPHIRPFLVSAYKFLACHAAKAKQFISGYLNR